MPLVTIQNTNEGFEMPVGSKYFSYEKLKAIIKPYHFQTVKAYTQYVETNDMQKRGWPRFPGPHYREKFKGAEDFLSLPPGTVHAMRIENLKKATVASLSSPNTGRPKKVVSKPIIETNSNITMKDICQYLVEREMVSTVQNILEENKLTLQDSIEITKGLIEYYDNKIKAVK